MKTKQIPYPLLWDKMPVDISHVFENEKPAGKHGFLQAVNGQFVFEDGTEARFWGTNFNSGANFPSHSHSEIVAKRLSMTGLNMVRLHQLDADWSTPNIFQFSKGKRLKNTLSFDPESMDRLDYMIYCLKNEGIYIYMDFLTYRRFKEGDGVANFMRLSEGGRPFSNFDRRMIELQKKYARDFLEHVNPYTGLAYKDEPCIALAEVANENDLLANSTWSSFDLEPYKSQILALYKERVGEATDIQTLNERTDARVRQFLCELQMDYYHEMISYLKMVGAKFPISGTNYCPEAAVAYCNSIADFTDNHEYWWRGDQRSFMNDPQIRNDSVTRGMAYRSVYGKPHFISEWDAPWPNEYRADSTLLYAAVGSLQNWGGFTIHTYRYGTNENESITGKIGRNIVIGNSYYRGIFDTYNDPAKFGLFYHAALITRRKELASTETSIISIDPEDIFSGEVKFQIYKGNLEQRRTLRIAYDGTPSTGEPEVADNKVILSDTKQLYQNKKKGYGYIDTDMTKAAFGFLGACGKLALSGVSFVIENDFATVAISSLTDEPISESGSMLLTAVGRADNSEAVYNDEHTSLLQEGKPPILIDVIEGTVKINTSQQHLKVWSIDNEGFYTGAMPSTYQDGVFSFTIGKEFPSMYYLIEAQ